ncbi:hypothetical protein JCM19302_3418 [Jejuia pallidilutea]|nr:hypothetical protein JCM19302_3418 [Jejuia pallidilutea]GAL90387.1 hypothetical protein JCM19538_152 [Jejuia pallidilutea]
MYSNKNAYALSDTLKVNERCSHCNTKYRIEPSFFYGAMYVSYAVGVAFGVAAFVISNLILGADLTVTFIAIVGTLIVFMPVIMRLSRNIWINMFMSYDETLANKNKKTS